MTQRFSFTLTTDAGGTAQSDVYLTNGLLIGVGRTPGAGQTGALTVRTLDGKTLLTTADISASGYDTDGSESTTASERVIANGFTVRVTGGVNAKTVLVDVDVLND